MKTISLKSAIVILISIYVSMMINNAVAKEVVAEEYVWKIADDVYRYGNPNHGYFSMFVITDEGVIVIEPMNTQHAKGMLKAIKNVTDKPIRYLLHSHNHWDHSKGGQVFRDQGAKIIAHIDAAKWMKANPHAELVLPDETWTGTTKEISLGGKVIELHYLGMNHGLGMTAFVLPKEKIAYIADIVTPNRMLFSIADFNFKEWTRTLIKLEALDFDKAVYSHSHAKDATGTKIEVIQTREFIEDLQAEIFTEFKKGTSFYKMASTLKLPKYKHWDFYDEWLPINVWNFMFQMEMGPFPWQPGS